MDVSAIIAGNPSLSKAKVRIDKETQKASLIDVVCLITGQDQQHASLTIRNIFKKKLCKNITQLRINGKGRKTPCADAPTCIEIIWDLPGKAARGFRRESAHLICRMLGGDLTLVADIERRYKGTREAEKEFFLTNTDQGPSLTQSEQHRVLLRKAELDIERQEMELTERKQNLKRKQQELYSETIAHTISVYDQVGMDERDFIWLRDMVRISSRQILKTSSDQPKRELSIPMVCQQLGLRSCGKGGQIGKVLVKLWRAKYNKESHIHPPKRHTTFRGKPYLENAYYEDDRDIVEQACRQILNSQIKL
jgi:hypothetical protein